MQTKIFRVGIVIFPFFMRNGVGKTRSSGYEALTELWFLQSPIQHLEAILIGLQCSLLILSVSRSVGMKMIAAVVGCVREENRW